ncbi:MAG: Do family serine endopeptidase [Devosia sp.]|nr:Do family serine endopeptidase [Devosia sp.]
MRFSRVSLSGAAALVVLAFMLAGAPAAVALQGPASVSALAAKLSPAVVNISSIHHAASVKSLPLPRSPDSSQLRQPLDQNNPDTGDGGIPQDAESLGSGFIISADGLIVTNNHVIDGADDVQIFLTDGTHWPAKLVGDDTKTDLAVLKIQAGKPLPFVQFGDSSAAQVGDWVMAIGNPFGLGGSVTLGIVSARNRDIQSGPYDSFIQTDASINQGNSGGPLFDMNGKVIGINTAIIAEGGASLGIGFAVPGDLAKPVVDQLIAYGETRRGWLGVGIQDVTEDIASSMGRTDTHGAMVTDITKSGPADGVIEEGDIILTFDGKAIESMHDLPRIVAETTAGRTVPVTVLRDGKLQTLSVTVGRLEDPQQASAKPSDKATALALKKPAALGPAPTLSELLGFKLAAIDATNRKAYALPQAAEGLVITSVESGSDADQKGLIPGLLVTEVNQRKVARVEDAEAMVGEARKAGRTAVLFKIVDPTGQGRFIAVKFAG